MTTYIDAEPEVQPQAAPPPPTTPKRTAVGTDDEERRRCKHCNHTKSEHIAGATCQGKIFFSNVGGNIVTSPGITVTTAGGTTANCTCTNYEPKAGR